MESGAMLSLLATDLDQGFELLVSSYGSQLYAFAVRWSGNASDAEDIVQIAFERAFLALADYEPERIRSLKVRPWLYKITLNVARNYVSRSRLQAIPLDISEEASLLQLEDVLSNQPEFVVENTERRSELEALVARLAPCYREVITLCFFGELSYQETATLLNKSIGTVKFYVHRGVALLRTMLQQQEHLQQTGVQSSTTVRSLARRE